MSEYEQENKHEELIKVETIHACYKCGSKEGFLLTGFYNNQQSECCSNCLRALILDDSLKMFLSDSKKYQTDFFNPEEN